MLTIPDSMLIDSERWPPDGKIGSEITEMNTAKRGYFAEENSAGKSVWRTWT